MHTYVQLCGALGLLKLNGVKLDWPEINARMLDLGRRLGTAYFGDPIAGTPATGFADPVYIELREMHHKFRGLCLSFKLIERGQLFDDHDCLPLN